MTQSSEGLDIVRAVYAALSAQDVDALVILTDPDIMVCLPGDLPFSGHYDGYAGLARFLTRMARQIDATIRTEELFAVGDRVVQSGRLEGTARDTGRRFTAPEVHVWRLAGERVLSVHFYIDATDVRRALTANP